MDRLQRLEESLWRAETRYDAALMDRIFAGDFCEVGRSGRAFTRQELLFEDDPEAVINARLPLAEFAVRCITPDVALVTYISEVTYGDVIERGRRSSLWSRGPDGWQLRFHQGTPI